VSDDNLGLLQILYDLLHEDFDLNLTSSKEEALPFIHSFVPLDLVLTDYQLPDTDGILLADLVSEFHPHTPILMMTAHPIDESFRKKLELSRVNDWIEKPFTKVTLVQTIEGLLERK